MFTIERILGNELGANRTSAAPQRPGKHCETKLELVEGVRSSSEYSALTLCSRASQPVAAYTRKSLSDGEDEISGNYLFARHEYTLTLMLVILTFELKSRSRPQNNIIASIIFLKKSPLPPHTTQQIVIISLKRAVHQPNQTPSHIPVITAHHHHLM